ncbi:MAG: hypothetical protein JO320_10290 [Alphaproteobacteria bacterium]|nr:hypothetical protein [Alphaproteobacteria bacterium]
MARAIGLQGMGGIGKTVLATALVQPGDPVRAAFPDGIVWLTFGRNIPILTKAAELAFALTGISTSFGTLSEARGQLSLYTADKRLLVVLDDVWEPEAVDAFTGLGLGCRLLITTRNGRVLERAQADRHQLGLLEPPAARTFLAQATDVAISALPIEADEIIRLSGRLPLALAAVGALIRRGAYAWTDAVAALREAELEELDTSWLPDPEQRSVAVVLKMSIDALSEAARACFFDCAAFREDVDVPEAVLLQLWSGNGLPERRRKLFAQELVDRSLMRRDEQRRYRIHDLYMDYLHHAAAPLADRHRNLIERYRTACRDGWATCPDDGYCLQHMPWHLLEANEKTELHSLLFDPVWLQRKLKALGVNALIGDYRLVSEDHEAGLLASAITMSAHVLGANPDHLEAQLLGRLAEQDGATIAQLLGALRKAHPSLFIPIRDNYLTPPGSLLRTIPTGGPVNSLAVLAEGRRALSGSENGTVRLWDLESGAELRRFEGHGDWVTSLAVLADGRRALSGSSDRTVRLWDLESGADLACFIGDDSIFVVGVSPTANRAILGDTRGRVLTLALPS